MRAAILAIVIAMLPGCGDDVLPPDDIDGGSSMCPVTIDPAPTWRQEECKLLCSPELGGHGLCAGTPTAPSPQLCAAACERFDVTGGHYCGGTP